MAGAYDPETELWVTSGPAQAAYDGGGTGKTLNILTQTGSATATNNLTDTDTVGDGDSIADGVQWLPQQE